MYDLQIAFMFLFLCGRELVFTPFVGLKNEQEGGFYVQSLTLLAEIPF